jgi:hypothetical protein
MGGGGNPAASGAGAGAAPTPSAPPLFRSPSDSTAILLECPVCLEPMTEDPVSLSCGHTAMKTCLLKVFETSTKCPTCRTEIRPEERRNLHININMRDIARRQYREITPEMESGGVAPSAANETSSSSFSACCSDCTKSVSESCSACTSGCSSNMIHVDDQRFEALEPHIDFPVISFMLFVMSSVALANAWSRGSLPGASILAYKLSFSVSDVNSGSDTSITYHFDGDTTDDSLALYTPCLASFCGTCHSVGQAISALLSLVLVLHIICPFWWYMHYFNEDAGPPARWNRFMLYKVLIYFITFVFVLASTASYSACHEAIYNEFSVLYTSYSHGNGWAASVGMIIVSLVAFSVNLLFMLKPSLCSPTSATAATGGDAHAYTNATRAGLAR